MDDVNAAEGTQNKPDPQEQPIDQDEALQIDKDSLPETESQRIEKLIARQVAGPDEKALDQQWEDENNKKEGEKKTKKMETFYLMSASINPNKMSLLA